MADGPPAPPTPGGGDDPVRDAVEEGEEFQKLQSTVEDLMGSINEMQAEFRRKDAARLHMAPPGHREFAEDMTGVLLTTGLGTVKIISGYHATAEHDNVGGDPGDMVPTIAFTTVLLGPKADNNFERGHIGGVRVARFTPPTPEMAIPGTGAPPDDKYEKFKIQEAGGFRIKQRREAYRDLLKSGVFDHLIVGGFDDRQQVHEALGAEGRANNYPFVRDVFGVPESELPDPIPTDDPYTF